MEFRPRPASELHVDIGEEQIASYAGNGFIAVDRVTIDEEIEWLREVYDTLLAMKPTGLLDGISDLVRPYGTTDSPLLGQLLIPERLVPQVKETVMWRNAHRSVSRLFGVIGRWEYPAVVDTLRR